MKEKNLKKKIIKFKNKFTKLVVCKYSLSNFPFTKNKKKKLFHKYVLKKLFIKKKINNFDIVKIKLNSNISTNRLYLYISIDNNNLMCQYFKFKEILNNIKSMLNNIN